MGEVCGTAKVNVKNMWLSTEHGWRLVDPSNGFYVERSDPNLDGFLTSHYTGFMSYVIVMQIRIPN